MRNAQFIPVRTESRRRGSSPAASGASESEKNQLDCVNSANRAWSPKNPLLSIWSARGRERAAYLS